MMGGGGVSSVCLVKAEGISSRSSTPRSHILCQHTAKPTPIPLCHTQPSVRSDVFKTPQEAVLR